MQVVPLWRKNSYTIKTYLINYLYLPIIHYFLSHCYEEEHYETYALFILSKQEERIVLLHIHLFQFKFNLQGGNIAYHITYF